MATSLRKISRAAFFAGAGYIAHNFGFLKPAGKFIAAFTAVVLGSLYWFQNKLLYIPTPDPVNFPREYQANPKVALSLDYENVTVTTADGEKVFAWYIPQPEVKNAPTVVYFHGNAGGIDHRLPFYQQIIRGLKVSVFAADYRGYGASTGEASEQGLKYDGEAFVDYLLKQDLKVIIFGRSLGGAVAVHVVSELEKKGVKIEGLIIENTFTNIRGMATKIFPFLKPFEFVLKPPVLINEWNSIDSIKFIKRTPVLMISGRKDELVPVEMMDELWKTYLASAEKEATSKSMFFPVATGGHNDTPIHAGQDYVTKIQQFISNL